MLLALDCGNTHIVAGVYDGERLLCHWRLNSDSRKTEDEYMVLLQNLLQAQGLSIADIDAMALGSVVPDLNFALRKLAQKYLRLTPLCVDSRTDTGIPILMTNPEEVGADRIINAVAAHHSYSGYLIVVDFGTATTFDCVSAAGEYLGGAIAPGIEISRKALFQHAARLANIPLEKPQHAIGRSTAEGLQSGTLWGFGGQVDGIVRKMSEELPSKPTVIATGGLAAFIAPFSESITQVEPLLTLEGLRLIYERQQQD